LNVRCDLAKEDAGTNQFQSSSSGIRQRAREASLSSPFDRHPAILAFVPRWATVTVTDPDGRRHSIDVHAASSYDAAHLYLVQALKRRPQSGLPVPTLATVFEVVTDGQVYHVTGKALQIWITKRREQLNGPQGAVFRQRPMLSS
jgi:hypothetical protein